MTITKEQMIWIAAGLGLWYLWNQSKKKAAPVVATASVAAPAPVAQKAAPISTPPGAATRIVQRGGGLLDNSDLLGEPGGQAARWSYGSGQDFYRF